MGYDITRILNESDFWPNDLFDALWKKSDWGDHPERLSPAERAYFFTEELFREAMMNGLTGYYWSSPGNHWREALEALRGIGATEHAALFEETFACWNDKTPPADLDDRSAILLTWEEGVPACDLMEDIYGRWVNCKEDRLQLQRAYVEQHLEQFGGK